jgi:SWI/SNF-related matrix-associated actin-dependent regulator of chromatin subfamily D
MPVECEYPYSTDIMPFLSSKVVLDQKSDKNPNRAEHPFMVLNQEIKKIEKKGREYVE